MPWAVESTDEFGEWFAELKDGEQVDVRAAVGLLEEQGPRLPFPYSSGLEGRSIDTCVSFVSSRVAGLWGVLRL
jgi:hypothetical protein